MQVHLQISLYIQVLPELQRYRGIFLFPLFTTLCNIRYVSAGLYIYLVAYSFL